MLHLNPENYRYCPLCASKLVEKKEEETTRKWCSNCGWIYYPHVSTAVGALIMRDDTVLMVKRNREPFKNTWGFPSGYVAYGEHPEETLIREIKEETGLTAKQFEIIAIIQNPDDPVAPGHFGIFYKIQSFEGDVKNNDTTENQDIQWYPIQRLPQIGWQSHKKITELLGFHYTASSGS